MTAESWRSFNDFTTEVPLRFDLKPSRLNFSDIAWFAPQLKGIDFPIAVSGKVRGTIAELKGRELQIGFGQHSAFTGSAELTGLPAIDETFMVIDVDAMSTSIDDLQRVPVPPFTSGDRVRLPPEIAPMGRIDAAGRFTGFLRAFTADGRANISSAWCAPMWATTATRSPARLHHRAHRHRAFRSSAHRGHAAGGTAHSNVRVKAIGKDRAAWPLNDGEIPLLTINGRSISSITAKGHLERNLFNGSLTTDDEKLQLDFKGLADLRGRWPKVDFTADLQHADLHALGFESAKGYNALNLQIAARGRLSPG
ncbi:MAG: hypothetical protein IPJ85_14195 [Flavobacteriales bacterium]|nr:hypothetical protein [Flavobacteriales bacterium]